MFLGKNKICITDIMSEDFECINLNTNIEDAFKIMINKKIKDMLVVNAKQELVGIIDIFELLGEVFDGSINKTLKNNMEKNFQTLQVDEDIATCKQFIKKSKAFVVPVLSKKKIVGVIRNSQILEKYYFKVENMKNKQESMIDAIHEAVCAVDKDGIVTIWNKNAERLYHVSSEEIVGRNIEDFFPDAAINIVRKDGKPVENKYHSPREGSYIVTNSLPVYVNGSFVGAVSTDRDVTEVKLLSSELEKANTKLNFLESEVKRFWGNFGGIIGNSPNLIKKIDIARQVAPTDASVIITGESGTGKEVFSTAIHEASGRTGLFVPVNCSAIPGELFESELFGYSPGAFTGASKKGKLGIFELANNGTVFLDEIGDMPMYMQAKLLRVLQEKEIMRVGGERKIKINVRVISATNKDLKSLVDKGEFREDFYYRLNVVEVYLPPLRERKEDIILFINHFLNELSNKDSKPIPKIENEVVNILKSYEWRGNIRELKNTIEHLVVMNKGDTIYKESIPNYILRQYQNKTEYKEYPLDLIEATKKLEIENIRKALEISSNNKARAAKMLNIPRSTLYYKMDQYKIKCQ